jgi:hypothetical protein
LRGPDQQPGAIRGPDTSSSGALFAGIPFDELTLTTAFEVAFRVLAKPAFILPIIAASVAVNAFLEAFILPMFTDSISFSPTGGTRIEDLDGLLTGFGLTFVIGIIGSVVVSMYGQIWAVTASAGPYPSVDQTFEIAARRLGRFLVAAVIASFLTLAAVFVFLAPAFLLIRDNPAIAVLLMLALIIPYMLVFARISMIMWLAADGQPVAASVVGSWRITRGGVLRILGWSIATGLVISLLTFGIGAVLSPVPLIGGGIAQGVQLAMGYGAGVTLFRRTQAAAMPPTRVADVPPVPEAVIG